MLSDKIFDSWAVGLFLTFSVLYSSFSYADCATNRGGSSPFSKDVPQPAIVVQRDIPVGTNIASITIPDGGTVSSCNNGGNVYYEMSLFTEPSDISNVYKTNIPGVGVSVSQGTSYYYKKPAISRSFTTSIAVTFAGRVVNFYKIGNISSGVINSGLLARNYGDDGVTSVSINLFGSTVTQLACSIRTPNLTFPIGDVLASTFGSSVGTVPSGAQNTQNLGLDCDANANINVMLQGTQNPDVSTTSVLALTGQGNADVAKGVGVQLLYNGSPLVLNNRIVLKRSTGGQEMFPITARYYQTKTAVATGKANASATLDLTYQ